MGRGFALSLCPGDGELALSKKFPGGLPGGGGRWSDLELTDTLFLSGSVGFFTDLLSDQLRRGTRQESLHTNQP